MSGTIGARARAGNADPFAHRAGDYAMANAERPDARRAERDRLLDPLPLDALRRVVDLQAASGYVGHGLVARTGGAVRVTSIEPSHELVRRLPAALGPVHAPLHALPIASRGQDAVVCLAGTHHSEALAPILAEAYRILRPGGWLSIAEAEAGDGPARWLNGFVDRWNGDGHAGRFVRAGELADGLSAAGFVDVGETAEAVPWCFADRTDLVGFCRTLFGIGRAEPPQVEAALEETVGIAADAGGATLRWRLRYAIGRRPSD